MGSLRTECRVLGPTFVQVTEKNAAGSLVIAGWGLFLFFIERLL